MGRVSPIRNPMDWVKGNRVLRALDLAVVRIDRFLVKCFEGYLEKSWNRIKEKAIAADPLYAEIEGMRKKDASGFLLFDPNNPRLGWDAWEYQHAVEEVFEPRHSLVPLARWASSQPLTRIVNDFIAKRQRVQRGWDFKAIYGLDYHIASTLGPQLLQRAEQSISKDVALLEEMRKAGEALSVYAQKDEIVLGDQVKPKDMASVEADIAERAKESLHWVADNLAKLSKNYSA